MTAPLTRFNVPSTPLHSIFIHRDRKPTQQFSHSYIARLRLLRRNFPNEDPQKKFFFEKIVDLGVQPPTTLVSVIGTLYKEQGKKPSALDAFQNELAGTVMQALDNWTSDKDGLVIEDESGRVGLECVEGSDVVDRIVTGVVARVRGRLNVNGKIVIENFDRDVTFPYSNPPRPRVMMPSSSSTTSRILLFASNLRFGSTESQLEANMLIDFCCGHLDNGALSSLISRVVIVGGVVEPVTLQKAGINSLDLRVNAEAQEQIVGPVRSADRAIAELAACVPVDVMPGRGDPTNVAIPQQPMHPCLFPVASRVSNLKLVTNPNAFSLGNDVFVVAHSGQPVDDILMNTAPGKLTRLEAAEACVHKWHHLAPTAPDTLASVPLADNDPFVLTDTPHIFAVGASTSFATSFQNGVRTVCVPDFWKTHQVVFVEIDTPELECRPFTFSTKIP